MTFPQIVRALIARLVFVVLVVGIAVHPAAANETLAYGYDALGRLIKVARSGTVNSGATECYTYDKASNRTNVTVATASDCAGGGGTSITVNPASLPNGTVGTAYSQTITASGGTGGYSYARSAGTLPVGLALNSSTGVLSGSPTTAAAYSFTILATDSASSTGSRAYNVTVSSGGATITLNPATLANGTVGAAYSQTITASGGSGGYTYSKSAGTLPAGIGLNSSTGVLSGNPTAAAAYNFTILATDSVSNTGSRAYTMSVSGGVINLSPSILPNGTVGTAYSQTISASGGAGGYAFSKTAGTLPAGLVLNGSTGLLSGNPTTVATSGFTITATDSGSATGARNYFVSITQSGGTGCSGVSYSVGDASNTEGSPIVFIVTKAGSTSVSCSVNYATADGSAVAVTDYTAVSGAIVFTSTETSKGVTVSTKGNIRVDGNRDFDLILSGASARGSISDSQGIGTVLDDDDANPCPLC